MTSQHPLAGVYAAAVTPLRQVTPNAKADNSPLDLESVPALASFLASRRLSWDRALWHDRRGAFLLSSRA